ncbi:PEGA domain-containing protein [Sorangium sp. So ce1024]|uniref:PEGA domain-containing protein n=1 Tax=Sorangium sp. So ce1024 TaxID=3133327 RepID=UPI003F089E69
MLATTVQVTAQPAQSGANASASSRIQALTGVARAEYEAAAILFKSGDYANAIIKFERVYELSPKQWWLLWDIALCHHHLRRYSRVIATAESLLEKGGANLSPEERKAAGDLIEATGPYVNRLDLRASEADAAIFVDGRQVGTTPLQKRVLLDIGRREIRVSKPGFKDVTITQEIAGGGETALSVVLEKEIHRGRLSVVTKPNGLIAIDGKIVGLGSWEGPLPSGGHTLRVTAPGMLAHQSEVMLKDDQVRRRVVELEPIDVLPRWLWVGGGAALLAGAVVTGVLVFRPEPPAPGTADPRTVRVAGHDGGLVLRFGASR